MQTASQRGRARARSAALLHAAMADGWRRQISERSGKALRDALADEGEDEGEGEGEGEGEEDESEAGSSADELEDAENGWEALDRLERQVDRAIAGEPELEPEEEGGGDAVVVIGDESDREGAGAQDEWEEVDVGGQEPHGAAKRKATKEEKLLALHVHRVHLLSLLGAGCWLSKQCDGARMQRRWEKLKLARELALPPPAHMQRVHLRAMVDWLHRKYEVDDDGKASTDKFTDVSLSKLLDAGKGPSFAKTLLFVSLLRNLGLRTRLVGVLRAAPFKIKGMVQLNGFQILEVLCTVTLYSKCTRAFNFENSFQGDGGSTG